MASCTAHRSPLVTSEWNPSALTVLNCYKVQGHPVPRNGWLPQIPGSLKPRVQALLLVVSHRMPFLVDSPSWFHRGRHGPAYLRVPLALEQAVTWGGLVTHWNRSAVPHLPARPQHSGRVHGGPLVLACGPPAFVDLLHVLL